MKLLATHDERGNIISIAVPAKDFRGQLSLAPEEGLLVTEVDATHIHERDRSTEGAYDPEYLDRMRKAVADAIQKSL